MKGVVRKGFVPATRSPHELVTTLRLVAPEPRPKGEISGATGGEKTGKTEIGF